MKFTVFSLLLAADSVLAAPSNVARSGSLRISEAQANTSKIGDSTMHFVVTDANYPDDTPTDCNLIWASNGSPKQSARCNNSQYYIRFPNGGQDIGSFTLELERVSGPIPEKGQAVLDRNAPGTKWICVDNPMDGVLKRCNYDGVLEIPV
ncbi:hypothetical protein ETB97_011248 [Aspergillus alliaceus]|uniref:AA1-like domain-containing protein n=1 Tax=Petromyces alliaceus TaxID=209559 RepID=A0A8H6A6G8_PETAA|nr:hypothetical protein ETB97_011248 [Aspergillus burnettii]